MDTLINIIFVLALVYVFADNFVKAANAHAAKIAAARRLLPEFVNSNGQDPFKRIK